MDAIGDLCGEHNYTCGIWKDGSYGKISAFESEMCHNAADQLYHGELVSYSWPFSWAPWLLSRELLLLMAVPEWLWHYGIMQDILRHMFIGMRIWCQDKKLSLSVWVCSQRMWRKTGLQPAPQAFPSENWHGGQLEGHRRHLMSPFSSSELGGWGGLLQHRSQIPAAATWLFRLLTSRASAPTTYEMINLFEGPVKDADFIKLSFRHF